MILLNKTLVLLLAGGVGSRLNILVGARAKPAVPFGGLYRIIDFSLSNVMNSGLTQVGVLTQYKPLSLMSHLGTGEAWDFSGRTRGVKVLPPRTGAKDSDWYKGTADAVRQNIDFIKAHPSKETLILSGDHIYQMDFDDMLKAHRRKNADITIGMMVVPKELIHQFGTGITNAEGQIVEWEEKPKNPRPDLASMGIYVFDTEYLLTILEEDREEVAIYTSMAKYTATEAAYNACDIAIQVHGGSGFDRDIGIITLWPLVLLSRIIPLNNEVILERYAEVALGLPSS